VYPLGGWERRARWSPWRQTNLPAFSIAVMFFEMPFALRAAIAPLRDTLRAEIAAAVERERDSDAGGMRAKRVVAPRRA